MARHNNHQIKGRIMSVLVCLIMSVSFNLLVFSAEATQNVSQPTINKTILSPQEVTKPIKETLPKNEVKADLPEDRQPPSWLVVFGPWFVGIVALFLAFVFNLVIPWWRQPKLKVEFERGKDEYAHKIFFDKIHPPFEDPLHGNELIWLRQPGFNSRVKVVNNGRSVAKNVQARLESIRCEYKLGKAPSEIFYHPTVVKWSGEEDYNKVDIAPFGSYFFLDLVYCINESYKAIIDYYQDWDDFPIGLMDSKDYSGDVYWGVWVNRSYSRGIPEVYRDEGNFELNYHVIAENCKPIKFTATISWEKSSWNNPEISIREVLKYGKRPA